MTYTIKEDPPGVVTFDAQPQYLFKFLAPVQVPNGFSVIGAASVTSLAVASQTLLERLSVNGNATMSGVVTFGGTVRLLNHLAGVGVAFITATGGQPSTTVSSNAGYDSAGRVWLNTTASPSAGDQALLTFLNPYTIAPFVVVTPASPSTAGLSFYVTASTTSFTVSTITTPPASGSLAFNYLVIG